MPAPFSPIIAFLGASNNADDVVTILRLANITGLDLSPEENYSQKTRVRAYTERALSRLTKLDDESQRQTTETIIRETCRDNPGIESRIHDLIAGTGWSYQDGKLFSDDGGAHDFDDRLPLFRRKIFDVDLPAKIGAASSEEPLSLLMIDLDHFKKVNDTYGHLAGDDVLLACAENLKRRCKKKGKAYRYGGEELAAILENSKIAEAVALAESIRAEVQEMSVGSKHIKVTVSTGIAAFPEHAQCAEDLIKAADEALYEAKELGRNLVRISGEPTDAPRIHTVARRQPEATGSLDAEMVRGMYFSGRDPICPKDLIPLRIRELADVGRRTPSLHVSCPICGLREVIHGET